jgi:hypothetical protein
MVAGSDVESSSRRSPCVTISLVLARRSAFSEATMSKKHLSACSDSIEYDEQTHGAPCKSYVSAYRENAFLCTYGANVFHAKFGRSPFQNCRFCAVGISSSLSFRKGVRVREYLPHPKTLVFAKSFFPHPCPSPGGRGVLRAALRKREATTLRAWNCAFCVPRIVRISTLCLIISL